MFLLSDANTLSIFRENSTLHHQVEQMLQKISPLQKCQEELGSLKAELEEKKDFIFNVLTQEEGKFNKTIDQGLTILTEMEAAMEKEGKKELAGSEAFKLYDTYGFPLDLTKEILEEKGFTVDEKGFGEAMQEQKVKARSAR